MEWYIAVLRKYTVFTGRASRIEFWYFLLCHLVASAIFTAIDQALSTKVLSTVYSLATLLPLIGLTIRRMHDINKSGWFILIPVYSIYLYSLDGDKGKNKYGSKPLIADPEANNRTN